MSNAPRHDKWADLLSPSYNYDEDAVDEAKAAGGRKGRRKAKKAWRAADHAARDEFIAQRKAEPVSQEARLGFAIFLTVVVVVGAVVYGVKSANGGDNDSKPATAATTTPTTETQAAVPGTDTTTAAEPSSEPTPTTAAGDAAGIDETASQWATAWFTYTPASGDSQSKRLDRAQPLMTDELARFVWEDDATATGYEKSGTDVEVTSADVAPAPEGAAPPDTDLRSTRQITVHTSVTAGPDKGQSSDSTYLVTLMRAEAAAPWQVADYSGQEH